MEVRDPRLLRQEMANPFDGYAVHGSGPLTLVERVVAGVALLLTAASRAVLPGSAAHQRRAVVGVRRGRDPMADGTGSRTAR